MRRLLPLLALCSLVSAMFVGVAWARGGGDLLGTSSTATSDAAPAAPFVLPSDAAPTPDTTSGPSIYGYVTAKQLGATLDAEERGSAPAQAEGAGTIQVTARVLPAVTIRLDDDGTVVELISNTDERDARRVLFHVDGGTLDAATWDQAHAALVDARAGIGTIWAA